jgi:hypothetical protein
VRVHGHSLALRWQARPDRAQCPWRLRRIRCALVARGP